MLPRSIGFVRKFAGPFGSVVFAFAALSLLASSHKCSLSKISPPWKAKKTEAPRTPAVTQIATSQNKDCEAVMSLISRVFMPKKEETKLRGRKMIVTTVKTSMAFPWSSKRMLTS